MNARNAAAMMKPERLWVPASRGRLLLGVATALLGPFAAAGLAVTGLFDAFPSLPFVVAIIGATLVGRLGAGATAAFVSVLLLDNYVMRPENGSTSTRIANSVGFVALSVVVAALLARHDRALATARRAQRLEETARRHLVLLAELSRSLTSADELESNLQAACATLVRDGWERAFIVLSDPAGQPSAVADSGRTEPEPAAAIAAARSGMVVPLFVHGSPVGALALLGGPENLVLGEEVGAQIARAVETARLQRQRVHVARVLQQSLLPRSLPSIPGLDLRARFVAGGEGTEVGGDFYDVFPVDEHTWMAVVGDVCGKGPEAAAVMTVVRATLRALALRERSPRRLLDFVNEALLAQVSDQRFATVCCAMMHTTEDGARLTVSSAGHPPPIVLRRDGSRRPVEGANGPLLGIFTDVGFRQTTVHLEPGESIVFYTDGIEGRDTPAEDNARALLAGAEAGRLDDIVDAFVARARAKPASEADDLVVLVVHAKGMR